MNLSELRPGQSAQIVGISGDEDSAERIMEMGLIEGTSVEVVRYAPLGDPIEITARGYHLTLRKREAALIEIEI